MNELSKLEVFEESIRQGGLHQSELYTIYKSSIGLINDLRNNSKRSMNQLAHVEDGLLGSDENNLESHLALLTQNIKEFNSVIGDASGQFLNESEAMVSSFQAACENYESKEGELSKLLEVRKQMLFVLALVRKYKHKINNLQLMNNVLFSLSADLKDAKDSYKSNLIALSTAMTSVIEQLERLVSRIENLN